MHEECSSTYNMSVMTQRVVSKGIIRGHCGLSGNKYRRIVQAILRVTVNPLSGLALILLTLPGNAFPSGKRVLRHFIVFKENML
jgi:hypothetical protein